MWAVALVLDMAGPLLLRARGLEARARPLRRRHGLIVIIALGSRSSRSGSGSARASTSARGTAAVLGVGLAAAMWWLYFDVVALVAARRLDARQGRVQNEMARDSYSYLHFPMVAGIVLVALGMKKTIGTSRPARSDAALRCSAELRCTCSGTSPSAAQRPHAQPRRRPGLLLLVFLPVATEIPALATLAILSTGAAALVLFETVRYARAHPAPAGAQHELQLGPKVEHPAGVADEPLDRIALRVAEQQPRRLLRERLQQAGSELQGRVTPAPRPRPARGQPRRWR